MAQAMQKWETILELLEADGEYRELERQRQESLVAFRRVMETLTQEQQDAIIHYIGVSEEQHWCAMTLLTTLRGTIPAPPTAR